MNDFDDILLMNEIRKGSKRAYKIIYERYSEAVYFTIFKKIKDKEEVDDVFQDFFLGIWIKRESIIITVSFKAWLFTSLRNHIVSHILHLNRKENKETFFSKYFSTESNELSRQMEIFDIPKLVKAEINGLPERMRTVWLLRKDRDMSISEISAQLNASEQTIKNQLNIASKRLKLFLSKLQVFFILPIVLFLFEFVSLLI